MISLHVKHPLHRALRSRGLRLLRRFGGRHDDRRQNRRLVSDAPRILFLRLFHPQGDYHGYFLDWLWREHPALAERCELRRVGDRVALDRYALLAPLVQDPFRELYPREFDEVYRLQQACDAIGIPVVNRVEALSVSRKSLALSVIRSCDLRCPRAFPVRDHRELEAAVALVGLPCILRDDLRHGEISLIRSRRQLARLRRGHFRDQVVCDFIDTADGHGIYRKYRYVLVGDQGAPRHLIPSRSPLVRTNVRAHDPALDAEELAYLHREDPNHGSLDRLRRRLGLDVVAFDYSYDRDGRLVVWEPNPLPVIWDHESEARRDSLQHQLPAVERIHRLYARYYAERAGMLDLLSLPARQAA